MKNLSAEAKNRKNGKPLEVVKVGSVSVPIHRHTNIVPQRGADGKPQALVKYQSDIFTIAYYEGQRRVRQKFSDLTQAKNEACLAAIKLANGESEALKLKGHDRTDCVRAMQKLREWKPDADLNLAVTDCSSAKTSRRRMEARPRAFTALSKILSPVEPCLPHPILSNAPCKSWRHG